MISTEDLVDWLKAVSGEEALIRRLERAAVEYVNEPGGRYFGARAVITEPHRWRGGALPLGNPVDLLEDEVFVVEEWDGSAWGTVETSRYLLSGRLLYLMGTPVTGGTHLRISYPAGYVPGDPEASPPGDPDVWDAPEDIQQAVRMLIAHWYVNRETVVVGVASEEIAHAVRDILGKYS